ncbi:TonB-dependent receptor [hydrothermal vent metagenome]|uniref:TonB-dependent receptor n=1 Tax=hydrothermal vent metagenome TaxID=652676 RepID=A0A3B0RQ85_9ZZZZ
MKARLYVTTSLLTLGMISASAVAYGAEDENDDTFTIEEITVTAQKRAENLQQIPLAITAISGDLLREDDITNLQDIGNRTPGMTFAAFSPGQPEIAIRGIGTKEDGASASDSVVVSVDDVYIAARTAQVFDIFDLERVEVLRGPQGTLYGKNSIGGSINFVTTKPGEDTEIRFRQTVGDYGRFDTAGLISGKIAENLFGKVSFSRRKFDGYYKNVLVGSDLFGKQLGGGTTFAYRGMLRWTPSEDLELIFSADGADDRMGDSNREPVGSTGPLHDCGCASDPIAVNNALGGGTSPFDSLNDVEGYTDRDVEGYSLKVNWDQAWGTFTSISAYRKSTFDWLEDSEGLPPSKTFVAFNAPGGPGPAFTAPATEGFAFDVSDAAIETTKQLTQEFRATSSTDGDLNWVVGAFYSREETDRTENYYFPSIGLIIDGANVGSDMSSIQSNRSDTFAVYADGSYAVSDDLTLRAGIRYSTEKKDMTAAAVVHSGIGLLLKDFAEVSASDRWSNVSWRVVADYQVTEDSMIYASVSTGFKSGGFTGSASSAAQATKPFNLEKATNFEVGVKSQFWDNRARFNVAAFYTDYTDLQVTRFFQPGVDDFGQFITENAGKAEIKGVEAEFTVLVTEGLEWGGSYAYLDAEYTEYAGSPGVGGAADFSGNVMRQAPEHSVYMYGKYTLELEDGSSLVAKVNYRYQSLSYYDPNNNDITTIPAYDLWDARIAWNSPDGRWELAGWVKNISNEEYRTHVFSQRGSRIAFALFGAPRTYGLTGTFTF